MITIKTTPADIKEAFLKWRLETVDEVDTKEFGALSPDEKAALDAKVFMQYLSEST